MNITKNLSSFTIAFVLGAFVLLATACGSGDQPGTSQTFNDNVLNTMRLSEAPDGALSVAGARVHTEPGAPIEVRGQVGGTLAPFVDGYAGFVLADRELVFCNEMSDKDHCSTPWDACCEDPDKLKTMRVSVLFVDSAGNPIQQDLKTSIGLSELDEVVVIGTIAQTSTPTNMIIHATGLYK
jgi:hypothetical protein